VSFFSSRWVSEPRCTVQLDGGLPAGFRAAGVGCGIKPSGHRDLGLIVSDSPQTTSAARFGRSSGASAPVLLNRRSAELQGLRAVLVNSGNANAATGRRGLEDAAAMRSGAAFVCGVPESAVAVASTGVIGVPLPMDRVTDGTVAAGRELRRDGELDFAEAIRTTDRLPKHVSLQIELSQGAVRLSVQGKGAGMISPQFATLLVFVQTDAALSPAEADLLLSVCVKRSFNRVSVDGQLSTSDTVILQCSGASGVSVEPESDDERIFGEAMDAALRQIALLVARDGEGARRVGRVHVSGEDQASCERVARAVGDSPLVKTALYGADPNWGRIYQAATAALPGLAPLELEIAIEGITVCEAGSFVTHDEAALREAVKRPEVEYQIRLPGQGAEAERFFSDLGHEYVTLNAEYTT
jgi:glutamate N-acetyltransferase/amino-acid N-acetyltransferase